jgi:hypothetical protein
MCTGEVGLPVNLRRSLFQKYGTKKILDFQYICQVGIIYLVFDEVICQVGIIYLVFDEVNLYLRINF